MRKAGEVPRHGTLSRVRQRLPGDDRRAGVALPEDGTEPVWLARNGNGDGKDGS